MLCPRCDIGLLGLKRKQRKLKEPLPSGKKRSPRVESLSDLERALTESRETASAVCTGVFPPLFSTGEDILLLTGHIGNASRRITLKVLCFTKTTLGELSFVKVLNGRCMEVQRIQGRPPRFRNSLSSARGLVQGCRLGTLRLTDM